MYKKKGLPEKGEFVVCTISRVLPHCAFCKLDEYNNLEGMAHTSEMDRRWVRNMKTYLKVGRQIVCKIMDVNTYNNHINLSIRRVGEGSKRGKLAQWKNEKRADDLLAVFAKQNKIKDIYEKIEKKILEEYGLIFPVFLEVSKGEDLLNDLIDKKIAGKLTEFIRKRISAPRIIISGKVSISSKAQNGLELIKKAVKESISLAKKDKAKLEIKYISAPKYNLKLEADDYKEADKILSDILKNLEKTKDLEVSFKKN